MARNPIQMQKGMSLSELIEKYGTEAQCEAALTAWRWPNGFVCPHCGERDHGVVGRRRLYLCHRCRKQTSLKAGTVFAHTHLPLTKWFQGMYLLTQAKNSISTLEFARRLGGRPDTATLMRHKLMSVPRRVRLPLQPPFAPARHAWPPCCGRHSHRPEALPSDHFCGYVWVIKQASEAKPA